jgi:hypothetical protein
MSNTCHRIDIEPVSLGQRGQLYLVRHDGAVLDAGSRNPEFDACRLLLAKGMSGKVQVWHQGAVFPAMRLDIEKGARLTVEESDRIGPRLARWYPRSEEVNPDAVCSSDVSPRMADSEIRVGGRPPEAMSLGADPPEQILNPRAGGELVRSP